MLAIALSVTVLAGCATFSRDRGFGTVVQAALLNNPGLQATYSELGIAEADLVQAGRMTNPHFAYLRTSAGGEQKLEWALTFPIIDLLTMPLRTRIESRRFEQVKLAVAGQVLSVATETRKSWIEAVAAEERVRYLEQVKLAAEASATLASRMERAGNFNRLDRIREEVFHAETSAQLALVGKAQAASLPEAPVQTKAATQTPLVPPDGRPYQPVVTLNGWTLPWREKGGWKEFHLIAGPIRREIAPGMVANLWGYNGQGPFGPLEMGGMFTVVKVREGLARGDYKDPGWHKHPEGSVAYEWKGALPAS